MKSGRTEHEEAAPTGAASLAYLGQLWGGWADTWDHPRSSRYLPLTSRYMREIPSIDELAEVIGQAQSGGQPLSAEQLAFVVRNVVIERRRKYERERKRVRAQRTRGEFAQAS